ncbi:ArsR/SmtB family transcription factor [Actinacidiphila alni]|uniref:ArsR/SmtB family transcription factor n=1 Tax=Actinacidiphila alni TaxID=380248 RepID=UPI003455841A
MQPQGPEEPAEGVEDVVRLTTDEQLRAVNNLVRHRIIRLLRDGPATISQVAEKLGLLKGSSSYHVRVLERAGVIKVVRTRKVRGVTERYYAPTSRQIELPDPGQGQPDVLMRHALADLEAAPADPARVVRLQHARIGAAKFAEFADRLMALMDELGAASEPEEGDAELAVAFFRPQDAGPARQDTADGEERDEESNTNGEQGI